MATDGKKIGRPRKVEARKVEAISDQLRDFMGEARKSTGEAMTAYAIAAESGVNYAQVSRFLNHKRSLKLDSVDRIAAALGLRLVKIPRAAKRGPAGPG